jgi:hypothetical protein
MISDTPLKDTPSSIAENPYAFPVERCRLCRLNAILFPLSLAITPAVSFLFSISQTIINDAFCCGPGRQYLWENPTQL